MPRQRYHENRVMVCDTFDPNPVCTMPTAFDKQPLIILFENEQLMSHSFPYQFAMFSRLPKCMQPIQLEN